MRIRKGRLARGSAHASLVMASPDHTDDINQRLELASSSRGFQQKVQGSETMEQSQSNNPSANPSFEKAPLALSLEKLQISSTGESIPPERPYMTLDEFVTSLARKNCFPADEHSDDPRSDEDSDKNISGQSSYSLTNTPVLINLYRSDDEEPQDMGKRSGAVSPGSADDLRDDIAAVETSLRLATPGSYKPANPRTSMEVEAAAAAEQVVQTMKSSTESMEQGSGRHTRLSSSPGRKRAAAVFFYDDDYEGEEEEEEEEEETDATDAQDEASSDYSNQKAESAPANERKKEKTPQVSSSAPIPVAKRTMKRSGRPKKLKYMQQDNVEELGNQCNRRDGKGWTCPLLAKPGYQLCDHHLDKLRCKPGSRSKYNKSKKKKSK